MPQPNPASYAIDLDDGGGHQQPSPDARSTPLSNNNTSSIDEPTSGPDQRQHRQQQHHNGLADVSDETPMSAVSTVDENRRRFETLDEERTCSSADMYKMRAHGNRGDRSPTRIEFNRIQRVRNQQHNNCFAFRKSETVRYKYAGVSVPADRKTAKIQLPTKLAQPSKSDKTATNNAAKRGDAAAKALPLNEKAYERRERIDVYFFERGNADHFCTTDNHPQLHTDRLARDTADAATRFWAEMYGSIHIVVAIVVAFALQTLRFALYSVVRPLTVGVIQIVGDYVVKPLLTACFNGCIQPPLMFGMNVLVAVELAGRPLCGCLRAAVEPLAVLLTAVRLVEVRYYARDYERVGIDVERGQLPRIMMNDDDEDDNNMRRQRTSEDV